MKFVKVRLLITLLSWCTAYSAFGQNYNISVVAGGGAPIVNIPATQANLGFVYAVASDSAGNIYLASGNYPTILRVDHTTGNVTSVVGTVSSYVAVDATGNLYFADGLRVRKFANGAITTVAGNGTSGFSGDSGLATSAQLSNPGGLAVDAAGNLYLSDGSRVRKVSNGVINTVAGGGPGGFFDDNVPATGVPLSMPSGLAVDAAGNLYIADVGINRVREVSNGMIRTVAGNGDHGSGGDGGPAISAQLNLVGPTAGVAVDSGGNLYIGGAERVRRVSNGTITTVAGGGDLGPLVGDNGPATAAPLLYIYGIAVDAAGNLYVADHDSERIRKVASGVITTVAGGGYSLGDNGPAVSAQLDFPQGVAVDSGGNVYVADYNNSRIRKISNGVITTLAGTGVIGGFAEGFSGDKGPAINAQLAFPTGVALDSAGNLYIADNNNLRIRKVSNGVITTVAGNGTNGVGGDTGPAASAQLINPQCVAVDSAGNLYIAEANRVRRVSNGVITTVAGTSGFPGGFSGDNGTATSAQLSSPSGIAVDSVGNLYIADTGNNRIRKVASGVITTVAGGGASLGDNGPATSAQLSSPNGVAVDSAGNLFIADAGNGRIRKVTNGVIGTVATTDPALGINGLALDPAGHIYFSDNQHVQVLTQSGCTYALNLGGQAFTSQGGTGSITINTQFGCPWNVGNLPASVALTSPASGTGTANVTFQVGANNGGDLSNSFTIAGQSFTVEQQASSLAGLNFVGSLAHLAAEENWTTSFTLVNKSNSGATVRLSLFGDLTDATGNGPLALPLAFSPQSLAGPLLATTFDRTLGANASLNVSSAGSQTPPVLVGSAQLAATGAVDGFGIFHEIATTQEAVVPMETRNASSYLLAFDNTNGLALGVAVENVSPQNAVIPVIIRDENGGVISSPGASISLGGNGHTSFVLSDTAQGFPLTANTRGTIEFVTPSGGRISVLGLRFTPPNNALTTIPALANIGTGGGSIAHLASGGDGWQTTFVLVNAGTSSSQFTLSFFSDQTGAPMSLPMSFPQPNVGADVDAPSVTQSLAAGATRVIVSGGAANLLTGSAQLTTTGNVSGFVVFRHNNQEAVVPLESRNANGYIIAFDNTSGTATGVAVNAVSAAQVNIPVTVRDSAGATLASDTITLAPNGHEAFTLGIDKYPAALAIRGTIEFDKPAGAQIGALGIRIPSGAAHTYTSLPGLAK